MLSLYNLPGEWSRTMTGHHMKIRVTQSHTPKTLWYAKSGASNRYVGLKSPRMEFYFPISQILSSFLQILLYYGGRFGESVHIKYLKFIVQHQTANSGSSFVTEY